MESDSSPVVDVDEEVALLKAIGNRDRDCFARLYDRYSSVLFSIALRILNDTELAEDVLQEVFLQIWEKAPTYDPERGKPLTWAVTLTRNRSIDRLRSVQRRYRLQDEAREEAKATDFFTDVDSAGNVERLEKSEILRKAVKELSKEQRQAIELAFFSGLTQSEVAEQLGEPLGTIKARIRRGMMKLRDLLGERLQR
jgi:RNA polymerase sigma-70 factor (ECF subfamily)